ncbi:MAG: MarR family transcriptional regulator [Propionicimonas sp.]
MSDRLANEAWEALMTAHARLLRRFAGDDWEELSMREYDVLYTLAKCPEPARMSELGQHVLLSQPGLSRLVDRLAQRGLVERSADASDGRTVRVGLTSAGAACQKKVGRRHARSVAQAMAGLTPSELEQLRNIATKLTAPLTNPPSSRRARGEPGSRIVPFEPAAPELVEGPSTHLKADQ